MLIVAIYCCVDVPPPGDHRGSPGSQKSPEHACPVSCTNRRGVPYCCMLRPILECTALCSPIQPWGLPLAPAGCLAHHCCILVCLERLLLAHASPSSCRLLLRPAPGGGAASNASEGHASRFLPFWDCDLIAIQACWGAWHGGTSRGAWQGGLAGGPGRVRGHSRTSFSQGVQPFSHLILAMVSQSPGALSHCPWGLASIPLLIPPRGSACLLNVTAPTCIVALPQCDGSRMLPGMPYTQPQTLHRGGWWVGSGRTAQGKPGVSPKIFYAVHAVARHEPPCSAVH